MDEIAKLQNLIDTSSYIVFFGGAGVSTESGLKDFRSEDGLYKEKYKFPPETILSHSFYKRYPDEFFKFYFDKMIATWAKPNVAHVKLAEMESKGKLKAVITQNIDGLHQIAGSKKVLELHGSVHRNYCERCGKFYSLSEILNLGNVPECNCGGIIKPDVVLYEESLDGDVIDESLTELSRADLVIVGGTSLNVYPAASFLTYARCKKVIINKSSTPQDETAELVINKPIGEVFGKIKL